MTQRRLYDSALEWGIVTDIARGRIGIDAALDAGLGPTCFGDPTAATAWRATAQAAIESARFSPATIAATLTANGAEKVAKLLLNEADNALQHIAMWGDECQDLTERVDSLRHWKKLREVRSVASIIESSLTAGASAAEIVSMASEALGEVGAERRSNAVEIGAVAAERLEAYSTKAETITTGISDLNRALNGGLRPGQLIILGARPGVGKSALALNIARAVARSGKRALYVSLEMSSAELTDRLVAAESRVPLTQLQVGNIGPRYIDRVQAALPRVQSLPLTILDEGVAGTTTIRHEAERLARRGELGLIVVDYLQLLSPETATNRSRNDEVAFMTRSLKSAARSLGCPILCLSQLSRGVEMRATKKPTLADLRDSGQIEADADVVLMLHRDPEAMGAVHLEVAKHRNGPMSAMDLAWVPDTLELRGLSSSEEI